MLQIQNSTADWQDRLNDVPEGGSNRFYGNWYARWGKRRGINAATGGWQ